MIGSATPYVEGGLPSEGGRPAVAERGAATALTAEGLTKSFGSTQALMEVDLLVRKSSVHALLGHNGSGKSTLIKVLAGYHQADQGRIVVDGVEMPPHYSPRQAHAAGLRFVHQDLGLVPSLSVAENFALDLPFQTDATGSIRWGQQHARVARELAKLELDVDPRREVNRLGPVEQTMVAVARALQDIEYERSVLFLDEPTARLPRSEVDRLLDILARLKRHGVGVVYVTHRLDEVFSAADEVTILRDGGRVFSGQIGDTDQRAVRSFIIGRPEDHLLPETEPRGDHRPERQTAVVEARDLTGDRVHGVDLVVGVGEVVAVTGLVGSGRSELGRLLYGIQPLRSGEIHVAGHLLRKPTPRRCKRLGIGYAPQERVEGLAHGLPVYENLAVTSYRGLLRGFGLSRTRMQRMARRVITELSISPPDPDAVVDTLSGGNQQKVSLGKWMRQPLRLLVLDEPLQGIDVGAKADIMATIRLRAQAEGLAVLWLESDIEEVQKYADRTLVMRDGRISAELSAPVSKSELLHAVYGTGVNETGDITEVGADEHDDQH